ncbi:RNA-directed DNA polymerase, eukaryota, reverse transcriptase zinc-binding domain protein, partial [Tanacetum coccineum]
GILRSKLKEVQSDVNKFPYDSKKKELVVTLEEFNEALNEEEKFLSQKAKVDWLCEESIDGSKIADEFVKHFENFLGQGTPVQHLDSLDNIFTKTLTKEEADYMVKDVSEQEIKAAMFSIDDFKEFFKSRKLLKEVNSTLISLIPKVYHPKLGRNIQDNILLTRKLLKGYNRNGGSKRCALKIDIAKAYDTVSWEFLRNVLIKFGFHTRMVDWIYTCISSSTFSICVNGEINGEYSVKVIKDSIDKFSRVSGLELNMNKSTIFFGNVKIRDQRSILNVIPFKVRKFLVKYLGVPLITKRLGREECKQLIVKVRNKIDDWKNKSLSYTGRMQLIASILNSMQVYWASVFLLPKSTPKSKGGLGFKELVVAGCGNVFSVSGIKPKSILSTLWVMIWNDEWESVFLEINNIPVPTLSDTNDKAMWRCNNGDLTKFTIRQTWNDYRGNYPEVKWKNLVWFS